MNIDMLAMLNNVAAATSNMDIEMIDIDDLHDSVDNFFHVDRVEELAESILATGRVKENLIVTPAKDGNGYEIVSGHRRSAAVRYLLENGDNVARKLPCLVIDYPDYESKLIDLIVMNVTQRQMSDADLYTSFTKLNEIFKEKKEKGEKFGKLREKIAEILNVSSSQVGKLQNVEKHAVPELKKAIENGEVSLSTANQIARLDSEEQKKITKSKKLSDVKTKDVKEEVSKDKRKKVDTSVNFSDENKVEVQKTSINRITFDFDKGEIIIEDGDQQETMTDLTLKEKLEAIVKAANIETIR